MKIVLEYEVVNPKMDFSGIHFSLNMHDIYGDAIFCHQNLFVGPFFTDEHIKSGHKVVFYIKEMPFSKGNYYFNCDIVNRDSFIEKIDRVASINIEESNLYNYVRPMKEGKVAVNADWSII